MGIGSCTISVYITRSICLQLTGEHAGSPCRWMLWSMMKVFIRVNVFKTNGK